MSRDVQAKPRAWHSWLRLSRVSNLPTVWTNTGTAAVLSVGTSGKGAEVPVVLGLMLMMSLFYVGGMILNDAFDAEYDAKHRSSRPIPSGDVSKRAALAAGFGLLGAGIVGITFLGGSEGQKLSGFASACALGTTIVVYDAYHKGNPASPVLMGFCRGLIYITVGLTLGGLGVPIVAAAGLQIAYVVGLTHAAKQEDLVSPGSWWPLGLLLAVLVYVAVVWNQQRSHEGWLLVAVAVLGYSSWLAFAIRPLFVAPRRIGEGVGRLIAGIAAVDAVLLALTGNVVAVGLAGIALVSTRALHRLVPGT